jgi:hypothetical protein
MTFHRSASLPVCVLYPRPGGEAARNWNGFDERGIFSVPDLPLFAVAIAAKSLPENAIITDSRWRQLRVAA